MLKWVGSVGAQLTTRQRTTHLTMTSCKASRDIPIFCLSERETAAPTPEDQRKKVIPREEPEEPTFAHFHNFNYFDCLSFQKWKVQMSVIEDAPNWDEWFAEPAASGASLKPSGYRRELWAISRFWNVLICFEPQIFFWCLIHMDKIELAQFSKDLLLPVLLSQAEPGQKSIGEGVW